MDQEMLADQWESRDRPVLLAIAKRLAATREPFTAGEIARDIGIDAEDAVDACLALLPTYISGNPQRDGSGRVYVFLIGGITERARREIGLWPSEELAAEALVELLNQAADQVEDQDDAGALRKAGRLLRSVPSAVVADVTAALIRQQTGL